MATIISHSVEETIAAGKAFAATLRSGDVVALSGDLGAGKTHFVKGIAQGLGYSGEVTSPTFSLVHEYNGGQVPCFHFDFYRLTNAAELPGIGFDEYLEEGGGVSVIEWAERFPEQIPETARRVVIEQTDEQTRRIVLA